MNRIYLNKEQERLACNSGLVLLMPWPRDLKGNPSANELREYVLNHVLLPDGRYNSYPYNPLGFTGIGIFTKAGMNNPLIGIGIDRFSIWKEKGFVPPITVPTTVIVRAVEDRSHHKFNRPVRWVDFDAKLYPSDEFADVEF